MSAKQHTAMAIGLALVTAGCTISEQSVPTETRSTVERDGSVSAAGVLTVQQAVTVALELNPRLRASEFDVSKAESRFMQARLLPNPELEVEIEDFGGTGSFEGKDSLETTVGVSQLMELAGKRRKRAEVARQEIDLSIWDQDAKRFDVITEAKRAVIETALAQENLGLREGLLQVAQDVADAIGERVKAGRVLPLEETRARLDLSSNRIERDRAVRELDSARRSLASVWGDDRPGFDRVEYQLETILPPPDYEVLKKRLIENPDLRRWTSEESRRQAALTLERSRRIPDVTLTSGVRRFNETDDQSFVVGFSVPLPIFDRNQGAVQEAERDLDSVFFEKRAAEFGLLRELAEAYRDLASAYEEATLLKSHILPGAESTFDSIQEGYREGKFGYLEVLDAQRTLFEAKSQYLKALGNFHLSTTAIERLIAQPITSLTAENEE